MPTLSDHIARIARDEALPQRVEEAARQTAVLPVLDALGWDCWDGNEVTPEFEVRGGRVDYCLQVPGQRLVLIEVKRTGADLTGHQEQLLRYAFDEGVPLAALTDGRVWWLYLSTAAGSWEQRRFYSIDFRQQAAASAAADLERFLSRSGVTSGAALEEARREFESQERDRRVRAALEQAWRQVLGDRDGLLRDLLAEEVEELSGHPPDPDTIAEFLAGIAGSEGADAVPSPVPRAAPGRSVSDTTSRRKAAATRGKRMEELVETVDLTNPTSAKGRRPAAFWLDGARHEVTSWRWLLPPLCEQLARDAGPVFAEGIDRLRGQPYLYTSPPDSKDWIPIAGTDRYVYVNITADLVVQRAANVVRAVRGSDAGFRIELARAAGRAAPPPTHPVGESGSSATRFAGRRIAAYRLDGTRHGVRSWPHSVQEVCDQLAGEAGAAFAERVADVRGRTRVYLSERPDDLQRPRSLTNSHISVEGNVGPDRAVRLARRVLVAVRGSDAGFEIELAE